MAGIRFPGARGREGRLAAASAILLFAAYPPFHLVAPSFVALAPLALAVWSVPAPRQAIGAGFLFGLLHYALLLHWMVPALLRTNAPALLLYATVVLSLALAYALVCAALHRVRRRTRLRLSLAFPLVWTMGEWLLAHLPGTLAFPWLGLGTSLTGYPELAGIAELLGARGVTFWLAAVNGLVAEAVLRGRGEGAPERVNRERQRSGTGWSAALARAWPVSTCALVVLVLPAAWGIWRAGRLDVRPGPTVTAAITGLRPQPGEETSDLEALAAVEALLADEEAGTPAASLVVLPEGTFRNGLEQPVLVDRLSELSRRMGAPVLFGVVRPIGPERAGGRYNSAALVGPEGLVGELYDKRRLVPWVERLPLEGLLPGGGGEGVFHAGREPVLLNAGEYPAGVLVCYEAAFPEAARSLRRAGARLLVNITNDAWFSEAGTFAVAQHEAHLVMRAIETRTGAVRSANLGPGGFIDPAGRVHGRDPGRVPGVVRGEVGGVAGETWFVRLGDVTGPLAAIAVAVLLLLPPGPAPPVCTGEPGAVPCRIMKPV